MKWLPEDRLNAFAAALLAEHPEPPRNVSAVDMLRVNLAFVGVLAIPPVFAAAGFLVRQPLGFSLIGLAAFFLIAAVLLQRIAGARTALRSDDAAAGKVIRVEPGMRASKILTVEVGGPGGAQTRIVRAGAANVYVQGDVVRVMVDPQTRQVELIVGLLQPSPLYAPPSP